MALNQALLLKARKQAAEGAYQGRVTAYSKPKVQSLYRLKNNETDSFVDPDGPLWTEEEFVSVFSRQAPEQLRNYTLIPAN